MSKQVQLKFKKLLKKAEFVHADLEYHEELVPEAKQGFFAAAADIFNALPDDVRRELNNFKHKQEAADISNIKDTEANEDERDPELQRDVCPNKEILISDEHPEGINLNLGNSEDNIDIKSSEIKKLFHKIAGVAHPDKTGISGLLPREAARLEELFKRATEAYNNNNWYTLYAIAIDLGIEIDSISEDQINWLEEDIRGTMGRISRIGNLVVWAWYVGDDKIKRYALKNYFKQTYNHTL